MTILRTMLHVALIIFTIFIAFTFFSTPQNTSVIFEHDGGCIMNAEGCELEINDAKFLVKASPLPIEPESPFTLTLTTTSFMEVKTGFIQGVNMYMGKIPLIFEKTNTKVWKANVLIGSCSEPLMEWQVVIKVFDPISNNEGVMSFSFKTKH